MIRVLVVDDYQEHVDTLVTTLNMYGAKAKGCSKGNEALEIAESWEPHLIIYDALLEGMRAWDFFFKYLNAAKRDASGNVIHRPYLVALTGFTSTQQRRLCEECGGDVYIGKPIELSHLLTWMQKARELSEQTWNTK